MPLVGHSGTFFIVDGAPPRAEEEANPVVLNRRVEPAYFETLGIEFAAGRPYDDVDGPEGSDDEGNLIGQVERSTIAAAISQPSQPHLPG